MLKKLFDLYVHLYIAEDIKNKKPRVEARRLMFLTLNIYNACFLIVIPYHLYQIYLIGI